MHSEHKIRTYQNMTKANQLVQMLFMPEIDIIINQMKHAKMYVDEDEENIEKFLKIKNFNIEYFNLADLE